MQLWTEIFDPEELSAFARKSLMEKESKEEKGSLAAYLPNETEDTTSVRFYRTDNGLPEAATYRAWDAESSIGGSGKAERVTIDLPPVSRKERIGELDSILAATNSGELAQKKSILKVIERVTRAVSDRVELARADLIQTGRIQINDLGFKVNADMGRRAENTKTVANLWSSAADATPLQDIEAWVTDYIAVNGVPPENAIIPRPAMAALKRSEEVRNALVGTLATPSIVTDSMVISILQEAGLRNIQTYDRRLNVGGTTRHFVDQDTVLLLPAAGTAELGRTVWGRTAEATAPEYAIAEAPGILAATLKQDDPYGIWGRATAVALPILENPDSSMVAKVL